MEFNEIYQEAWSQLLYHVFVLRADQGKTKIAALASDWLRHFRLLLWNHWTEFNETWQEERSQRLLLPSLCFTDRSENKMAALTSDWLGHFRLLLWNHWIEFKEIWKEARSQRPLLPSLCFTGRSENKMAALASNGLRYFSLLLWNRWTEFNETWKGARSQHPLPSLCFSGWSKKKNPSKPPWPLIGWDIFDFSSESTERNLTKLDRKQNLNVFFYHVSVLQTIGKQDSRLASDWLKHLRLLLWNHLMEFNEAWQETRSQFPYQVCVFRADKKNKDGRTGLWLAETFSTSPVKPLNGIQRTLAGSKISSSSSTKFVFYGPIGKQDGRPGLWLADIFLTSSLKPLNWIQRNLTVIVIWTPLSSVFFSGW